MTESIIQLKDISKKYHLYNNRLDRLKESLDPRKKSYHRDFYALKDINLEVKKGEILGIVGKNGSGKSTLLKIISGVLTPTNGTIIAKGNIVALLELGSGFNPEFTGIDNVYFYCALLGYKRDDVNRILDEILDFAELGDFIYQPLKTYSSGMKARLAFSVSVNVNPDILILDEVLSVGDELFRRKCYARMEEFFKGGKTILFVSHSIQSINELCSKVILLDQGEFLLEGPTRIVTSYYYKYIYSIKGKEKEVRNEIIALNNDEALKKKMFDEIGSNIRLEKKNTLNEGIYNSEIKLGINQANKESNLAQRNIDKPYFIPDFQPKSTVVYKNSEVTILEPKITTIEGIQVNCLLTGEEYYFEYKVESMIEGRFISMGFQIKNEKGLKLSGASLANNEDLQIQKIDVNECYIARFKFKCNLLKGNYYINCGISGVTHQKKERIHLYRIIDAIVFKVLPSNAANIITGIVSLEQELSIIKTLKYHA